VQICSHLPEMLPNLAKRINKAAEQDNEIGSIVGKLKFHESDQISYSIESNKLSILKV